MARKKTRFGDDPDAPPEDAPPNGVADPEAPPAAEPTPELALLAAHADGPAADPLPTIAQIQDRLDRLEQALAPLHRLDGLEERLLGRVTATIDRAKAEAPVATARIAEPSILDRASALGSVGKHLLNTMVMPAISHSSRPPARPWAIREILAELQAMFYMYVDPRYRLSWPGRVGPPVLLGLFLTTAWWAPYFLCGLGALLGKPIELVLCFGLIKLVSYEARRYRETAPDLPPSLRP